MLKNVVAKGLKLALLAGVFFVPLVSHAHAASKVAPKSGGKSVVTFFTGPAAMENNELVGVVWQKAAMAGDVGPICAMYDEQSIAYMPDTPVLNGQKEICAYFTNFLNHYTVKQKTLDLQYKIIDNRYMIGGGTFVTTVTPKDGTGDAITVTSRTTDISEKKNGKWIVWIDHASIPPNVKPEIMQ